MQDSMQALTSTVLSTDIKIRLDVLKSMWRDSFYYDVCSNGGVVLLNIKEAICDYMKKISDKDDEKILIEILTSYINKNCQYDKELIIRMLDGFGSDFIYHKELVIKGFRCERDYVASICEECAEIFDHYWNTNPCRKCGEVWFTKS